MKIQKRMIAAVVEILIGLALIVANLVNLVDSFWSGMGGALLLMGVLQLIRCIRYQRNDDYRENVNVSNNDERNRYLAMKAWSWAGYFFVLIAAVATIALRILGLNDYSMLASSCVCLIILLYWISYLILRKKY